MRTTRLFICVNPLPPCPINWTLISIMFLMVSRYGLDAFIASSVRLPVIILLP